MKQVTAFGKIAILVLLFISVGTVQAADDFLETENEWIKTFDNSDGAYSVQQTSDGGYILTGSYMDDVWLGKTDSNGNMQWDNNFDVEYQSNDVAYSIQQTSDDGYILAGLASKDAFLIKTDPNGTMQWSKTFFEEAGYDRANSVQETSDGCYILTGSTESDNARKKAWIMKIDPSGNMLWDESFEVDEAYSVQQTSDGGYIAVGGPSHTRSSSSDILLIKIDPNGKKQWVKIFGGNGYDVAKSVQQTSDSGYILAGYTESYGTGSADVLLIKTDADGNKLWDVSFGGAGYDEAASVQQTSDNGYILAGGTQLYSDSYDIWLIKTDHNGNIQWDLAFGADDYDIARSVQQTSDGSYILAGSYVSYTNSYGSNDRDACLIKVNSNVKTIDAIDNIIINENGMSVRKEEFSSSGDDIPAFEVVFSIAGLLAVSYLLRKRE